MAMETPLKKDVDRALKEIEILNRMYNQYFSGAEEDPPREKRRDLDALMVSIKSAVATATNASAKFAANSAVAKYHTHTAKWDKQMKLLEQGLFVRPPKRK